MDIERAARIAATWDAASERAREQVAEAGGAEGWAEGRALLPARRPGPDVRAWAWDDADYPSGLRRLPDAPPVLFGVGVGELPAPSRTVALIGSRSCSADGARLAFLLGRDLARAGVVVVSGMALGIDAAAHRGALAAGGPTVAVLASDVERPTPARHAALAASIAATGWLLSERPPGGAVFPSSFPVRNRLIAALAQVVVVVEAGLPSGTLATAERAAALGAEIGAVPGTPLWAGAAGSNRLLRDGAHVVTCADDVLGLLGLTGAARRTDPPAGDALRVWTGLGGAAGSTEAWVAASGLPAERALRALAQLRAAGWLADAGRGHLVRAEGAAPG